MTIALAMTGKLNHYIYQPVDMQNYWVTIPAGEFQMGSDNGEDNEKPVHPVYLDTYQIGKYEVTLNQYNQCIRADVCGGQIYTARLDYPVIGVSWDDAVTYCKWAGGRLPTEAEWEKAASWDGETQAKFVYPWGNNYPTPYFLNYNENVYNLTPVGTYPAGENGLYDMAGNALEWTSSLFQPYPYNANDGREVMASTGDRVVRGGSWNGDGYVARSAYRKVATSVDIVYGIGFRCSRSP